MVGGFHGRWKTMSPAFDVRRAALAGRHDLGGALPSSAVIEVSFGKTSQRVVDFSIDLDPLAQQA